MLLLLEQRRACVLRVSMPLLDMSIDLAVCSVAQDAYNNRLEINLLWQQGKQDF